MNQAYFFSTLRGNDNNDGRSANTPWRTLRKMQEISFIPGTHILLERGSVFENEYLHLAGISGTDSDPIVVDAYGDNKNLPIIHANGHGLWYQDYEKPLDNPLHLSKGWVSSTIFSRMAERTRSVSSVREDQKAEVMPISAELTVCIFAILYR